MRSPKVCRTRCLLSFLLPSPNDFFVECVAIIRQLRKMTKQIHIQNVCTNQLHKCQVPGDFSTQEIFSLLRALTYEAEQTLDLPRHGADRACPWLSTAVA